MAADDQRLPMGRSAGLVDVLDRILDKGLVVAGDVKVALAEVELLTIRIRLIICSVDKAEKIGLDWWRADPYFSSYAARATGTLPAGTPPPTRELPAPDARRLESRIEELDRKIAVLLERAGPASPAGAPKPGDEGKAQRTGLNP